MEINHGHKTDFYRDFYAVDIKKDGTVHIDIRTLNIFQRALRYVFGAYKNTIWNQSKSAALKAQNPKAWKHIEASIENPDLFKSIFKIEKAFQNQLPSSDKVRKQARSSAGPKKVIPQERAAPETMSNWKKFGREQLQIELGHIGLEFKESTERGDCFFDSFAYLLTALRGDKQYTAQEVRTDISNYLQSDTVPHAKYEKLLKQNRVDANTYEAYKQNINKGASEGYDPIWGDDLAIQIACDIYNVDITVHSTLMLEATLLDTLENGEYEDFPYTPYNEGNILVCSKLIDKSFTPSQERPNPKAPVATLHLAHIENGPWAHFLPATTIEM